MLSSVVLGFAGIALGLAVTKLKAFESARGEIAAWMLIAFGFTYAVWGLHRAIRGKPHEHIHAHEEDDPHSHDHSHTGDHTHVHSVEKAKLRMGRLERYSPAIAGLVILLCGSAIKFLGL